MTYWNVCAASLPGSTGLQDMQPNPNDPSLALETSTCRIHLMQQLGPLYRQMSVLGEKHMQALPMLGHPDLLLTSKLITGLLTCSK